MKFGNLNFLEPSAKGRQHIRYFITQAVFYSLMLLKMGITVARNMSR
jgi:hypothetical protein